MGLPKGSDGQYDSGRNERAHLSRVSSANAVLL